ncbi:MAG: SOS response-associated peptidase family protein [Pseudomonadota bacterium]
MTRLYRLDAPASAVADRFGVRATDDPWAGGYVAPENFAPVITAGRDFIAGPRPAGGVLRPRMVPRLWGVLPPPSADDPTRRIATVRNPDSPFWIGNLRNSEFRCLIPATAIMAWGSGTDYEGRRLKHWFRLSDEPIAALLGVWKDEEVPAFALLTTKPRGTLARLGAGAAPIAITPGSAAQELWLHAGWDRARALVSASSGAEVIEIPSP